MTIVTAACPAVQSTATPTLGTAANWPAWTDDVAFWPTDDDAPAEVDPTGPSAEDDAAWAAETRDVEPFDDGPTDPEWDAMAEDALALHRYESGYSGI